MRGGAAIRKSLSIPVAAGALAIAVPSASAATIMIDVHFKDAVPKSGPATECFAGGPGGKGMLQGFGEACELFTFESFDGDVGDYCALDTGTDTITLDDAQRSSFTERERDLICNPGAEGQTPGHSRSYGNPARWTGTWTVIAGSGTGVFADACAGAGADSGRLGGASETSDVIGELMLC